MNRKSKGTRVVALIIVGALVPVALLLAASGAWAGPDARGLVRPLAPAAVVSNTLTYQGRLLDAGGVPVEGGRTVTFRLYADPSGGTPLWTQTSSVDVDDGLLNANLDVNPALFDGQALWLGVQVAGDAQEMSPRQPLLPAPYALALPGLWTQPNATSPNLIGGYRGNSVAPGVVGATIGGGGDSTYPNQVTGDYGTIGGGLNNEASGGHATLGGGESNTVSGWNATVGGGYRNNASSNSTTIGGGDFNTTGGGWSTIGGGMNNEASDGHATIGGGSWNTASGKWTTVGGGRDNEASGWYGIVGGGYMNHADALTATIGGGEYISVTGQAATVAGGSYNTASGDYAAVGGGLNNEASGGHATLGGGESNTVSGWNATVGGGYRNNASSNSATIGGGDFNTSGGGWSTIGGGVGNTASGAYASIPGGQDNTASGDYSFAAGQQAQAIHDGAFVWNDSYGSSITSQRDNQFLVQAYGGSRFEDGTSLWVEMNWDAARPIDTSTGAYLSGGGTWTNSSDRNLKENFVPVDSQEVLAQVAGLPITTWNYKAEDPGVRHMGPVAQDFYATFGLGADDRHIASSDAAGVALVAIQGLYAQNQELTAENAALQAEVDDMEARVAALEAGGGTSQTSSFQFSGGWWALGGLVVVAAVVGRRRYLGGGR